MSILIKAGSGLVAGIVAGSLGLVFFPRPEPNAVKPRAAVEKPQFVVASPSPLATVRAQPSATVVAEAPRPTPQTALAPAPTPSASPPPTVQAKIVAPSPPLAVAAPKPTPSPAVTTPQLASANASPAPVTARAAAVTQAPAPVGPSAVARKLADAAAPWSVRGLVALAKGDLSSARVYLSRAADAGDPRAFVALADTYDPAILSKLGVVGAPGDSQRAKDYLAKAAAAGVVAAKDRMAALDQNAH